MSRLETRLVRALAPFFVVVLSSGIACVQPGPPLPAPAMRAPASPSAISAPPPGKLSPPPAATASATALPPAAPGPVTPPESLPPIEPALAKQLGPLGVAKLEVALSVCAAALKHDAGKLLVGCRMCPPFDASSGPDGRIAIDPTEDAGFFELETLVAGSFSKPGANEVAAVFNGCESHAENFGGTMLAERRGAVWVALDYRSGLHPLACKPFRLPEGRDLLICRWETDHQSYVNWLLDSYDFTLPDGEESGAWEHLLALSDNTYSECWGDKEARLTMGSINDFRLEPAQGARPARLIVKLTLASAPQTPAYWAICRKMEASETPGPDPHRALAPSRLELSLRWDGKTFTLDAASAALLRKYGQLSDAQ